MRNFFSDHPFIAGFVTLSAVDTVVRGLVYMTAIIKGVPYEDIKPKTVISFGPTNSNSDNNSRSEQDAN